jgi:hypothetical protein
MTNDTLPGAEPGTDPKLRTLLAGFDPVAGEAPDVPTHLLDRIRTEVAGQPGATEAAAVHLATPAGAGDPTTGSWWSRHWQGTLLAAASVAALALAAATVLPGLAGSGSDSLAGSTADTAVSSEAVAGSIGAPEAAVDGSVGDKAPAEADRLAAGTDMSAQAPTGAGGSDTATTDESLVRSGSLLVGTDDVEGGRDSFVATVLALGGRVTSETVVTEDGGGAQPYPMDTVSRDMGMSYPYPWWPTGPGIWLSVQVPVDQYDKAIEAARATGEVIQMQQSTYDVGAQVSDVEARIAALEASLARLTELMDEATDISDVIALEQAISARQSELDSLRAQQRDLANQTAMSQISLTLMSPDDARATVEPQPEQTWWESFLEGLGQAWAWLGRALLIISPLLLALAIIWWVRRRRARPTAAPAGARAAQYPAAGPTAPADATAPVGPEGS